MKVVVDRDLCIGSGQCVFRQPAVFDQDDDGFVTLATDEPGAALELGSMLAMDDPEHARLRRLVQAAFTLRAIRGLEDRLQQETDALVSALPEGAEFDFVEQVAAPYPLQVICDLLAVPEGDRDLVRKLVDEVVGAIDPDFQSEGGAAAGLRQLYDYAIALGRERKAHPGDDITSRPMTAEVDGSTLTPDEFGSFMILLIGAGIDTTRTSLSWAVHLLSRHPEQRTALLADVPGRLPGAIEEVVRWASPVVHMRRTATRDTVLGGRDIAQGDKVVMWYLSANHDENVFAEADRFDITRPDIADHVGFGAGGPHFCLGANLARAEIRTMLLTLFTRYPELHATAEPELLVSPFINGIKTLPCTVR